MQQVRFCGIDVGSQYLKLVCRTIAPAASGLGEAMLGMIGSAPEPAAEGELAAIPLGQAIAGLREQVEIGPGRLPAAASLPTGAMLVKPVFLPVLSSGERRAALYLELDRLLADAEGEVVGDYLPLAYQPDAEAHTPQEGFLLLAARQQTISALRTSLVEAHLRPVALEPEPATLYRLARLLAAPESDAPEVLVDLGAAGTRLLVVQREKLLLFRDLPVGGSHLTAALAQHLHTGMPEAEELKRTKYRAGADLAVFGAAGERLLREVERSLRYIERERHLEGYNALHLVGGGAEWPFLRRLVEVTVGIQAEEQVLLGSEPVGPAFAQAAALALWQQGDVGARVYRAGLGKRTWQAVKGGVRR